MVRPSTLFLGLLVGQSTCVGSLPVTSADLAGWRIEAKDGSLSTTFLESGAIWHSELLRVTSRVRTAQDHIGGWKHDIHREVDGGLAQVQALHETDDGVTIDGVVKMPSGNTEVWSLRLTPATESRTALAFELIVGNSSGTSLLPHSSDHSCHRHIQFCYTYASTDVSLLWTLEDEERLVGGGEQYSTVDLRGQAFDLWSGEQGVGRGRVPIRQLVDGVSTPFQGGDAHTTYSHVPAFLSTKGYGVVLDNGQLMRVDFTSPTAAVTVSFEDRGGTSLTISGRLLGGGQQDVRSLLEPLTAVTGRMQPPPSWALDGLVVGAEGGHEAVSATIEKLLAAGVPVAGVWIQDWSGHVSVKDGYMVWWNWELDEASYPKSWFRDLAAKGIKVLTYMNPMLASTPDANGRPPSIFLEAERLGHLLKDTAGDAIVMWDPANGVPYGHMDLFREDSFQWWAEKIRCNVLMACEGDGEAPLVHGWMHDYAEQLIFNASVPASFGIASDVHNLYPQLFQEAATAAVKDFDDIAFFSRSGNLRSPGVTRLFWLGDQLTNYDGCDGLQSAVIGAMSGGLSGWTVTHSDLGGFTMVDVVPIPGIKFTRDAELLVRWLETGVFINSMFRSHPGLQPEGSSQLWDAEVVDHTRALSELFASLRPYRESLLAEATASGMPPVRHGLLVKPEDPTWFEHRRGAQSAFVELQCSAGREVGQQQFFWGDELLVAPVYAAGRKKVHVYIPQGSWAHLWTKEVVTGPRHIKHSAPLGQPTAFYRVDDGAQWKDFFGNLSMPGAEPTIGQGPEDDAFESLTV